MPKEKEKQKSCYQKFDESYDKLLVWLRGFWVNYLGVKYVPLILIALIALVAFYCGATDEVWTDVFRALLVPVIAFGALAISWMQYEIKKQEGRQFSFDKKYNAFIELSKRLTSTYDPKSGVKTTEVDFWQAFDCIGFAYGSEVMKRVCDVVNEAGRKSSKESSSEKRFEIWKCAHKEVYVICKEHMNK